ncbi:hypothetical protein WA026_000309 [Henosepilachna vigintioctopunctata]
MLCNEELCSRIWKTIVMPLLSKSFDQFRNPENLFEVCDEQIEKSLGPTIHLINDVLKYFFDKSLEYDNMHIKKLNNILLHSEMIESVRSYLYIARNENLTITLGKIGILLLYFSLVKKSDKGILKVDIEKEFMEPMFSLLGIMVETSKVACVTTCLYFILDHWYKLSLKLNVKYQIEKGHFKFEDQFMVHLLMPSFVFCQAACDNIVQWNDLKEEFTLKLFTKLSEISVRWGYKWRDIFQPTDVLNELGPKTIYYILQLKPFLSRDSGVMAFQSLLYLLKHINKVLEINMEYVHLFSKCECNLKILLEALREIITYFNISWNDTLESLCVFQTSVQFSKYSTWPSKIVIADLNLIQVAIKNYLSPDLTLLIDKQYNGEVMLLGSILHTKLHDPEWAVRDSALEVISAIAEASCIEFQSFQKVIVDNDLCNLVLNMSLLDGESFVRASAIKCLNNLVQIDLFWKNHLKDQDIIVKMILLLKQETEGIVRAQAVTLLTTIYRYHDLEPSVQKQIYISMNSAVMDDLHWEVRLNALDFWNERVEQKLKDQGMVDKEFPECTFSPESKKIVKLTVPEIKKRIMRVLDDLSKNACLTILKHSIWDDCDLQVSKKGSEISKHLVDLIQKYNIVVDISLEEESPLSNDSCYSSVMYASPSPSTQNGDDVIDQIMSVSDTYLLKDVYNPGNVCNSNIGVTDVSYRHIVTASEFINLTKKNIGSVSKAKETWVNSLDSFSSLLNDMLENYERSDTNAMDCY